MELRRCVRRKRLGKSNTLLIAEKIGMQFIGLAKPSEGGVRIRNHRPKNPTNPAQFPTPQTRKFTTRETQLHGVTTHETLFALPIGVRASFAVLLFPPAYAAGHELDVGAHGLRAPFDHHHVHTGVCFVSAKGGGGGSHLERGSFCGEGTEKASKESDMEWKRSNKSQG